MGWIKFLGTAGARVVVSKQLRASGGIWFNLRGVDLLVDPGPGSLVKCFSSKPKLDPTSLKCIIVTHRHLDHSADINVMIEAMTEGGYKKRGMVYATAEALEEDPVILRYLREFPEKIEILAEGGQYKISEELSFSTPVRHLHPVETYGLKFFTPQTTISYIVDTLYFPELTHHYKGGDLLLMNLVRLKSENDRQRGIYHLNVSDAKELVAAINPKMAVLTHFGMTMIRAKPWLVAEEITRETGVHVLAASDGMTFDLARLKEAGAALDLSRGQKEGK